MQKKIKLSALTPNDKNPRFISDEKLEKLKKSIEEFPKMMELRPIIYDENKVIIGGNMRHAALTSLGYNEVPQSWTKAAGDLTDEEIKRFVIADNVGFGEWDWQILSDDWDSNDLEDWGLQTFDINPIDLDSFFEDDTTEKIKMNKITLEYNDEDFQKIQDKLKSLQGSNEKIIFDLLVI